MTTVTGGCLYGAVRYRTTGDPVYQLLCYCTDCQTVSGAAGYAAYGVPIASLVVTKGSPAVFNLQADSGRTNSRSFCRDCGTRLWARLEELGFASINGLTFDERSHFQPTANHYPESAPDWCEIDQSRELFLPIPREQ